jgi:N6-adenosine-specific RNA methylase IME4
MMAVMNSKSRTPEVRNSSLPAEVAEEIVLTEDGRQWATRIAACWQKSTEAIIATGRLIAEAKAALKHGEFIAMVQSQLPFDRTTALRLMTIGADTRIANDAHVQHLPPHWGTLYELTKLDDGTFEAGIADGTISPQLQRKAITAAIKAKRRTERERILGGIQCALPTRKFGVILADPEWRYEPWSRMTGMDRAADNHYPTSATEVIAARDVPSIAADDCVLFLWATVPMLAEAFCVLDAWGFARFERDSNTGHLTLDKRKARYVSSGSWTKYRPGAGIGMGHWFRVDHELLLVATRGDVPAPAQGDQARSVFDMPASQVHSQKPELVLEIIEGYFPTLPKIELNRRGPTRPGWTSWGNEAEPGGAQKEHNVGIARPSKGELEVQPAADALDIPPLLRRGHPDCAVPH